MTEDWPQQEFTATMSLPLYLVLTYTWISGLFQSLVYSHLWSISISGLFPSLVYFNLWSISISDLFPSPSISLLVLPTPGSIQSSARFIIYRLFSSYCFVFSAYFIFKTAIVEWRVFNILQQLPTLLLLLRIQQGCLFCKDCETNTICIYSQTTKFLISKISVHRDSYPFFTDSLKLRIIIWTWCSIADHALFNSSHIAV